MTLDSWHHIGGVILRTIAAFLVCLESCTENVMGILLLFQEYK